jgi:hypothetical protein
MTRKAIVLLAVVAILVLGIEAALGAQALNAHRRADERRRTLDATQDDLGATETTIAGQHHQLDTTKTAISDHTAAHNKAKADLAELHKALDKVQKDLAHANVESARKAQQLAALEGCAKATLDATAARNAGDTAAAAATLRNAQGQCDTLRRTDTANPPVFPFDFADPAVLRVDDTYYAYSTNAAIGNMQVITSTDLTDWTIVGDGLPLLPSWAIAGGTWAPSVVRLGQYYVAYYTVREAATWGQCISVAISTSASGPFLDPSTAPIICQRENSGSIDPRVFVDGGGTPWLLWTSGRGVLPGAIWSQQLTPDGLHTTGPANMLVHADRDWENGVTEAPAMVETPGGGFALFYSGNLWGSDKYALGMARCMTPTGPCRKLDAPVFTTRDDIAGPGSADFFTAPTGQLMMIYGAYQQPNVGYPSSRLLHVDRVDLTADNVAFAPR